MLYELMDLFIFFCYYYEKGGKKRDLSRDCNSSPLLAGLPNFQ